MERSALIFFLLFTHVLSLNLKKQIEKERIERQRKTWSAQPTDYWIDQPLDHFNPLSTVTFRQRFWMNDTFSYADSLLLAIGGEAPLDDFYGISGNILSDIAQENNMLLVYIEHRFYGASVPNNDSSTENLRYLTTQQALEDYAYFLKWAKSGGLKLSRTAKVVTFGCSYSGMLSAFFRQKYSWLTVGAIAGSAPVFAQLDFPGYDYTVQTTLQAQYPCNIIVKNAFSEIVQISKSQGMLPLMTMFNTCPQSEPVVLADITSSISGLVQGAVQGNNPDAGFPVQSMCSALKEMIGKNFSEIQALAVYVKSQLGGQCLDVNSIGDIISPGAGRSWTWQTCIEYGFFQTDSASKIFGNTIHLDFYTNICAKAFQGIPKSQPDVNLTNVLFGGFSQDQSSWIIFSNGLQDPWGSNLGINYPLGPTLPVSLSTSAHCAAYHVPSDNDPLDLIQSRMQIKQFVTAALNKNNKK